MRWLLPLLALSLLTLAFSFSSAGGRTLPGAGDGGARALPGAAEVGGGQAPRSLESLPGGGEPVSRVGCERPRTLRLRRFEDRSASLVCAGRVIVRVSVPG